MQNLFFYMHLGKNIKYLRQEKRLTQDELAAQLEKSSGNVSAYEKGKILPPVDVIIKLCEIFHVSLDDIIHKDLTKEEPGRVEKEDPARLVAENDDLLRRFLILKLEEVSNRLKDRDPELYTELRLDELIQREKKNLK